MLKHIKHVRDAVILAGKEHLKYHSYPLGTLVIYGKMEAMSDGSFIEKRNDDMGRFILNGDLMSERGYVNMPNIVLRANKILGEGTINHSHMLSYASLLYVAHYQPSCREKQEVLSEAVGMSIPTMNKNLKELAEKKFIGAENHGNGRSKRYPINARVSQSSKKITLNEDLERIFEDADDLTKYGYTPWPNFILTSEALSPGEKVAAVLLLMPAMRDDFSFQSRKTLALLLGVKPLQAGILVKGLEEKKFIRIERRGQRMTNKYHFNFGAAPDDKTPGKKSDKHAVLSKTGLFVPKGCCPGIEDRESWAVRLLYSEPRAKLAFQLVDSHHEGAFPAKVTKEGLTIDIDAIRVACKIDIYQYLGHFDVSVGREIRNKDGHWNIVQFVRTKN